MRLLFWLFFLLAISSCGTSPVNNLPAPSEKSMVFKVKSSLPYMSEVAKVATCVMAHPDFKKEVESVNFFESTDDIGTEVYAKISKKDVILTTYSKRFSSVLATTYRSDREHIYFNIKNNPRKIESMANTAIHEATHLSGYSHFSNRPNPRNDMSVPYFVGKIAEKHAHKCL